MVEEGEFKKRIRELIELKTSDELSLALIQNPRLTSSQAFENRMNIRKSYLNRIIDEAKKEFEDIEGDESDHLVHYQKWFLKWFGK
jgi:hypothetical protein